MSEVTREEFQSVKELASNTASAVYELTGIVKQVTSDLGKISNDISSLSTDIHSLHVKQSELAIPRGASTKAIVTVTISVLGLVVAASVAIITLVSVIGALALGPIVNSLDNHTKDGHPHVVRAEIDVLKARFESNKDCVDRQLSALSSDRWTETQQKQYHELTQQLRKEDRGIIYNELAQVDNRFSKLEERINDSELSSVKERTASLETRVESHQSQISQLSELKTIIEKYYDK